MKIDELIRIMPPPVAPIEIRGVPWSSVERQIGTPLPTDFKHFIDHYGTGHIDKFMSILNPFSINRNVNLIFKIPVKLNALRTLRDHYGEKCSYSFFPDAGGLLPVAITDNGDVIYWLTAGPPDDWDVVVNESRGPEYQRFECGLTEFLVK